MLQLYTFGELRIELGGQPLRLPTQKARDLLAYLILHHDRPISRDFVAGTFWPDRPDPRARRALSQALWQIRQALGPAAERLATEQDTVIFSLRPDDRLDVAEFEEKAKAASLPELSAAAALYRADFLQGCYDDWGLLERERLRELHLETLERLIALHKQRGEYEKALVYVQRLVAADPLHESAHQELMRLYHLLGRDRAALEQYQALRHTLADEVGDEPMAGTVLLVREIAAQLKETEPPYLPLETRQALAFERPDLMPLVGREEERATLLAHLEAVIGGQGGAVLVEGEAGVGKTRLLQEVARGAEWREAQACWGRGRELAGLPPYGVLQEALRAALSPLRATQLAGLVEGIWLREMSRLLPELAEWLPDLPPHVDVGPEQQRARLLEALARTVSALGHIASHLLILEDLQWADASTLSALAHLTPRLAESRVLVIGSYRGEDARETPAVWEALQALDRGGGYHRLLLKRLDASQTGELVRRGLGLAAEAPLFEKRLHQETDGNPLFVLETLRALQDEGLLYRDESGEWSTPWDKTTADYTELPLPAGVCQVINRRLARLGANERATLNVAAVLGGDFGFTLLAQAGDLDKETALKMVGELLRRRFLVEEPGAYRFSHDKIRQVAYAGIEKMEWRRLHRQAGQALETLHPERIEQLAHHFDRGQVWDKATVYNRQAGQRARDVYAGTEAFNYYSRAIKAWERLRPCDEKLGLSLHEERGRICQDTGRLDQAAVDFQVAHDLAERTGDKAGQARILNDLSYLRYLRGDFGGAAALAEQALEVATAAGLPSEIAAGLLNKATALRNTGHYRQAIELYERAAAIYEELDDRARLADCLNRLGGALIFTGDYAKACAAMQHSLTICRQLDDKLGVSYALINLAAVYYYQGQLVRAREIAQEALEVARTTGEPSGEWFALGNLGQPILEQGFPAQAIPLFQRALRMAQEVGDRSASPEVLYQLGRAYYYLGHLEQAQEALEQALSTASDSLAHQIPLIHAYLAQVYHAAGREGEALSQAHTGLQAARELGEPWTLGLAHRVMGEVATYLGEEAGTEPTHHFEESIRILREIGAAAELARSLAAYGLYLRRSSTAAARRSTALLNEARASFQQLEMAWDLARLEEEIATCLLPGQISVCLPAASAPTGRPLRDDETVTVIWTVDALEDKIIPDRIVRRHLQLLRLLREAADQSATPTVPDLAQALGVGVRTVERDLAALRAAGHEVHTRGGHPR
ncbi:MAG: tetratricopeptide repeat protein [Anaerolineae bacterium]|nr:tetratricopeptide repeat protein [Anaerolineae bacterium]